MNDRDKILPCLDDVALDLVVDPDRCYRVQLNRLGMEELMEVAKAQRDADWERIKPLVEAAKAAYYVLTGIGQPDSRIVDATAIPDNQIPTALFDALAQLGERP